MATQSRPPTGRAAARDGSTAQPQRFNPPGASSGVNPLFHNNVTHALKHAAKVSVGAVATHLVNNGNVTPNGRVARHSKSSREAYGASVISPVTRFQNYRAKRAAERPEAQGQQAAPQGAASSPRVRPASPGNRAAGNEKPPTACPASGIRRG